ncbi:hypothetical protein [Nocardia sp. NPDC004415]
MTTAQAAPTTTVGPKVKTDDLSLTGMVTGHDKGIGYATGVAADGGIVTRLAEGTFVLNPKGTKVLVVDNDGDVIDKWPLTIELRGHVFTLTPKILEDGHRLKLTPATKDGKPLPARAPRPAGAAGAPARAAFLPDAANSDLRNALEAGGFAVGSILGSIFGAAVTLPTGGTASPVGFTVGYIGGGYAGRFVGDCLADFFE